METGTLSRAFEFLFASFSRNFTRQDLVKNLPRKEYLAVAEDWEPVLTDVLVPAFQFVYQVNFCSQKETVALKGTVRRDERGVSSGIN